jgi:cell shape-determining protein MreD
MIFILFIVATLGTLVVRVLFQELFIPVLLLFVIGYTMMAIKGVPHDNAATSTTALAAPPG